MRQRSTRRGKEKVGDGAEPGVEEDDRLSEYDDDNESDDSQEPLDIGKASTRLLVCPSCRQNELFNIILSDSSGAQ